MKYFILTLVSVLLFNVGSVEASAMQKCDVGATLKAATEANGVYEVTIVNSKVLKDDGKYGGFCFAPYIKKLTAKVEGENIPEDKEIILRYETYSAMGEDGKAISSKKWSYDAEYKGLDWSNDGE